MNKIYLAVTILFFFLVHQQPINSQERYYWSAPVSLTDSVSNNLNPQIHSLKLFEEGYYAFWEKSTDSLSTSIYYKNFYSNDAPQVFIFENEKHITNIQMVNTIYNNVSTDTSFYAFYESDVSGTNKVHYRVFNEDGLQDENTLTTGEIEQTNLICNNYGRIVWLEENKIMHVLLNRNSFTFSQPIVIDSGNCSFPSVEQPGGLWWWGNELPAVAWIKEENDSSSVKIRNYDNGLGWLEPITLFRGKQCKNLSFCTGIGALSVLTWDYYDGDSWKSVTYDLEDIIMYSSDFSSDDQMYPRFYSGFIPVKGSRYLDAGIFSIIYKKNDITNIYTSPFFYGIYAPIDEFENVSNTDNLVRLPKIHSGQVIGCNHYFINTWEEYVNNHWQIKYSISHECLSNVEQKVDRDSASLNVYPNPTINNTNIVVELKEDSEIEIIIFNANGFPVDFLEDSFLKNGEYRYDWATYSPGLYFIQLRVDNHKITKKVVVLN